MGYRITDIEGIGASFAKKLAKAGVVNTDQMLDQGKTKKVRSDLAKKTGISDAHLDKWAKMADVMRIKGVAEEYSELLVECGVKSVTDLCKKKPDTLVKAFTKENDKRKLVRLLPSEKTVTKWIAEAKKLPGVKKS
jgi:predicted flap endonuclease-1-like 5' DNA nuclease